MYDPFAFAMLAFEAQTVVQLRHSKAGLGRTRGTGRGVSDDQRKDQRLD